MPATTYFSQNGTYKKNDNPMISLSIIGRSMIDKKIQDPNRNYIDLGDQVLVDKCGTYDKIKQKLFIQLYWINTYLTKKEIEAYYYSILGHSAPTIASLVNRSKRTVESHLNNIKQKLHCEKHGEIIAFAISSGLIYTIFDAIEYSNKTKG